MPNNNIDLIGTQQVSQFRYGANCQVINKADQERLSYAGAYKPTYGSFGDLARHIGKGHPWMPGVLKAGARRMQAMVVAADLIAVDIDEGLTLEGAIAHPFISAHAGLIIESASSKPEHHKFRLVFRLPRSIASLPRDGGAIVGTDFSSYKKYQAWQIIRICNQYLVDAILGVGDPQCKDASRFFFGAQGRSPVLVREEAALPEGFVDEALRWHEDREAEAEAIRQRNLAAASLRRSLFGESDQEDEIEQVRHALTYIPGRGEPGSGTYNVAFSILCALTNHFGAAEAERLIEEWSPSKGDWQVGKKITGLARSKPMRAPGLGTLFYHAKQGGYRPQQKRQQRKAATGFTSKRVIPATVVEAKAIAEVEPIAEAREILDAIAPDGDQEFALWLARKKYKSQEKFEGQYVDYRNPQPGEVLCLKAGLGAGKTEWAIRVIKASPHIRRWIYVTTRNALCHNAIARMEVGTGRRWWHLNSDEARQYLADPDACFAMCIHSLPKLSAADFEGAGIIFDEGNEISKALTGGDRTLKTLLGRARASVAIALKNCESAIILDGGLNNATVEIFEHLAEGSKRFTLVEMQSNAVAAAIDYVIEGTKASALMDLKKLVAGGAVVAIATDSQVDGETLDRYFQQQGLKGARCDRFTQEDLRDFMSAPDQWIATQKPQYLIYSPTAQSGLDISIHGYFSHVFGIFEGVLRVDDILQMMFRVRDTEAQRYLYCPQRGHLANSIGGNSPEEVRLDLTRLASEAANLIYSGTDAVLAAAALMQGLQQNSVANRIYSEFLKNDEYECENIRLLTAAALQQRGYTLHPIRHGADKDPGHTELKKAIKLEHATAIAQADSLSDDDGEKLARKINLTRREHDAVERWKITSRLPGIDHDPCWSPELVCRIKYEDRTWLNRVEAQFHLFQPQFIEHMERNRFDKKLAEYHEDPAGFKIQLDATRSMALAIATWRSLGIGKFLEAGRTWSDESPEVIKFLADYRADYFNRRRTGITPKKNMGARAFLAMVLRDVFAIPVIRVGSSKTYRIKWEALIDPDCTPGSDGTINNALLDAIAHRWAIRYPDLAKVSDSNCSIFSAVYKGLATIPDSSTDVYKVEDSKVNFTKRESLPAQGVEGDRMLPYKEENKELVAIGGHSSGLGSGVAIAPCGTQKAIAFPLSAPQVVSLDAGTGEIESDRFLGSDKLIDLSDNQESLQSKGAQGGQNGKDLLCSMGDEGF